MNTTDMAFNNKAFNKTIVYKHLMDQLSYTNTSKGIITELKSYKNSIYKLDLENKYGEPMKWIGLYIAVASLCCILAMVADLLHGLTRKKWWFPCRFFSVNALSLTVIAVAMKLPVDLSGNMPGDVDQAAKLGSMAFMCTMMANLLPCLATMGTTELLTNVIALGVLVITLVVNICIQISTGVIGKIPNDQKSIQALLDPKAKIAPNELEVINDVLYTTVAAIFVAMLLLLLIIYVCSSLAILGSKKIMESKYQKAHKSAPILTKEQLPTVEKLQQHVNNYWIMAGSSNPQFIQACSATTAASGVICALALIFHLLIMIWAIPEIEPKNYDSDYMWSTLVILIVQFVGVILGTFAPLFRCFASLNFKLSFKSIYNHFKVLKVEEYWTKKLDDLKHGCILLPFRSHTLKVLIINLRNLALNICIILQVFVVVVCKIIALIFFLLSILIRCLKWPFKAMFRSSVKTTSEYLERQNFVLQLEDEHELAESIVKGLSKYLDQLIKKSEKKQPKNLMKLITERSTKDFQGVRKYKKYDDHPDCWSLAVVTLTTIASTLPNIENAQVKSLLKSVREGLEYVTLVEENLNATDDYKSIQKAAKTLWEDVDSHFFRHKWLGFRLKDIASQRNTTTIVQLFLEKAELCKKNIKQGEGRTKISICANSMSCIAQTIIDDKESHEKLFDELSSRIADIMAACLTNLPQVIAKKSHTNVIEKREASVKAAARLLGETKEIIKALQDPSRHVPSMNPDDLPFINKWRAYLSEP